MTSSSAEQLVHLRQETIPFGASGGLRSLGKLWGMDVFSWHEPYIGILCNTIHSFPFPVIWLGGKNEVTAALNEDEQLLSNLHSIITTDSTSFTLDVNWISTLRNYVGTGSVTDALEMLKVVKAPKKVLLFTSSGEHSLELRKEFETYVKLVQVQ